MNIKEEATIILNNWQRHVQLLEQRYLEDSDDELTMHEELISYIDKTFINKELVQEICQQGTNFLLSNDIKIADYCSEHLKNDRITALEMVKSNGANLELINKHFKNDKDFILKALEHSNVLCYVSEKLRDDEDVVTLSVHKNPKTIFFASDRFKNNSEFVFELIKKDNYLLRCIHLDLRDNEQFMLNFWHLMKDRHFESHMILHSHALNIVDYMGDSLKPFFKDINFQVENDKLCEQMQICFDKFKLHKELKFELTISNKQIKKTKI